MSERKRAAAVIVRDGHVLMIHERSRRAGGGEWWTLPGGGLEADESPEQAVRREVFEETRLVVKDARYLLDAPYPSGMTAVFVVTVVENEPVLGADDGAGPELLGLDWLPLPDLQPASGGSPVPLMVVAVPTT